MGMRPSVNLGKRKLRPWVKVLLVVLAVVIGVLFYQNFFAHDDKPSSPSGSVTVVLPPPPAFEKYVLAFPEDPVMSEIVKTPFNPTWRASINIPRATRVAIIGGLENQAPFPTTCMLPERALVYQYGATVADGRSYMLAEYGGQEPAKDGNMYTVEGGCQIGTLFVPTDDMLFAYY